MFMTAMGERGVSVELARGLVNIFECGERGGGREGWEEGIQYGLSKTQSRGHSEAAQLLPGLVAPASVSSRQVSMQRAMGVIQNQCAVLDPLRPELLLIKDICKDSVNKQWLSSFPFPPQAWW